MSSLALVHCKKKQNMYVTVCCFTSTCDSTLCSEYKKKTQFRHAIEYVTKQIARKVKMDKCLRKKALLSSYLMLRSLWRNLITVNRYIETACVYMLYCKYNCILPFIPHRDILIMFFSNELNSNYALFTVCQQFIHLNFKLYLGNSRVISSFLSHRATNDNLFT